ncbi:pyrimidine reductase family protein [Tomitella fengzijianii]|uniref:pyrimidine reductase family protein n=1 Tax=Tomitella fengzijianii TaxID=2597660 RepID=UPI001E6418BE|nr:pyrimidine reductase family protein [Tomitella fengzijianii]
MHRDSNATQFTALDVRADGADGLPRGGAAPAAGRISADGLAALYAYPETTGPWLRMNFITSVDGAVAVDGRSGRLGGPGDRRVFGLLRSLADVIVVGAGTVRTENYGGARIPAAIRRQRAAAGRPETPRIAVVSASARIDAGHRVFHDTAVPPLVLVSASADPARVRALSGAGAEVVVLPERPGSSGMAGGASSAAPRPDVARIAPLLAGRGLPRVLCEGGPNLAGQLLAAGAVDELCLTLAPMLVGGNAPRMAVGPAATPASLSRRHLLADDDGALFTRWTVARDRGER